MSHQSDSLANGNVFVSLVGACGGGSSSSGALAGQPSQAVQVVNSTLSGKVLYQAGKGVAGVTISVFHHNTNTTVTTTTHANGAAYWSSTTYTALTTNTMAIRMSDGRWVLDQWHRCCRHQLQQ